MTIRSKVTHSRTLRSVVPTQGKNGLFGSFELGPWWGGIGRPWVTVVSPGAAVPPSTRNSNLLHSWTIAPKTGLLIVCDGKPGRGRKSVKVKDALSQYCPTKWTTAPASMPCIHEPDGPS